MHFVLAFAFFYLCYGFPISNQYYSIDAKNQISPGKGGIAYAISFLSYRHLPFQRFSYGKVDTESFLHHGWYKLHINTVPGAASDLQLAFAAGYLEGML
jgi:hypothetical protein